MFRGMSEEKMNITQEMKDHFLMRTKKHIALVNKYYSKFYKVLKKEAPILHHDASKFESPEMIPYIYIAWEYLCKREGKPFSVDEDTRKQMNKATEHHVRNSKHHPEYWSDRKDDLIPKEDRDKFDPTKIAIIDVSTTMPKTAIVEMCADWCGMSEEKGNTPFEWADTVVDKRWKFGDNTDYLYKVLEMMWE